MIEYLEIDGQEWVEMKLVARLLGIGNLGLTLKLYVPDDEKMKNGYDNTSRWLVTPGGVGMIIRNSEKYGKDYPTPYTDNAVKVILEDLAAKHPDRLEPRVGNVGKQSIPDFDAEYRGMTTEGLQRECQKRGLAWRDAGGDGAHLRWGAMVNILTKIATLEYKVKRRYAR